MNWVWIVIWSLAALLCEACLGLAGAAIPATMLAAFYMTVVFGSRMTAAVFIVAAMLLDLVYARSVPTTVLCLAPAVQAATVWLAHGNCRFVGMQVVPGAALGLVGGLIWVLGEVLTGEALTLSAGWFALRLVLTATCGSALLLPLLCLAVDAGAEWMGMPLYRNRQEREADDDV